MPGPRPIVTLTTDFGLFDYYVAAMKAAVLRQCPEATLVDVTHQVSAYDILAGSIALERAVDAFDAGTIHLAVVDPGVGTSRRLMVAQIKGQYLVCPDNGLLTWAWRRWGPRAAYELTWRPTEFSATFHGRDILAPAAGRLAAGHPVATLTQPATDPVLLPVAPATNLTEGKIIHIDNFGNATTNVGHELLDEKVVVYVHGKKLGSVRTTYADVSRGHALALIGSSGLLEIAVREGSAADHLGLEVGAEVGFQ